MEIKPEAPHPARPVRRQAARGVAPRGPPHPAVACPGPRPGQSVTRAPVMLETGKPLNEVFKDLIIREYSTALYSSDHDPAKRGPEGRGYPIVRFRAWPTYTASQVI